MKFLSSVIVLVTLCFLSRVDGGISLHDELYCFADDPIKPQSSMFATQSSYEPARGQRIDPSVSSKFAKYSTFLVPNEIFKRLSAFEILVRFKAWRAQPNCRGN